MQNYLEEAKTIVDKDKRDLFMHTSKASINGAITGLVIGLMVGFYKKYNIYASGLTGAIVGGADDTAEAKKRIMRECGIFVVDSPAEIGKKVKEVLG